MLAQLEALREASIRPNMQIHIMRFSDGLYRHWNEPYVLFEFDLPALGPVLFRESPVGCQKSVRAGDLQRWATA